MAKWLRKKDLLEKIDELYDRVKELEICEQSMQRTQCDGKHTWVGRWFGGEVRCAKCGRKADEGDKHEALTGFRPFESFFTSRGPIPVKTVGEAKVEAPEARDE